MKLSITPEQMLAGAALLGLAYVVLNAGKIASAIGTGASAAAQAAAQAVNPVNRDNVFASGVNSVGKLITADDYGPGMNADGSWSLGAWLYDVTHENPLAANTGGVTGSW